jgi:hypothetical protein
VKGDKKFTVSNNENIKKLKITYLLEVGMTEDCIERIRLFCLGKELKNDLFLYSYDIGDDLVCQAMVKD